MSTEEGQPAKRQKQDLEEEGDTYYDAMKAEMDERARCCAACSHGRIGSRVMPLSLAPLADAQPAMHGEHVAQGHRQCRVIQATS